MGKGQLPSVASHGQSTSLAHDCPEPPAGDALVVMATATPISAPGDPQEGEAIAHVSLGF
jgi:hypothetical protein